MNHEQKNESNGYNPPLTEKWWETEWFKEWLRLSERPLQKDIGYWDCYYNEKKQIIYRYIAM